VKKLDVVGVLLAIQRN